MTKELKPEEAKTLQDEAVEDALHEERIERCVPLARKILTVLATESPFIGDINDVNGEPLEEANESYNRIALIVLGDMFDANIKFTEKLFVFQLVKQAASLLEEKVQMSLDRSMEKAEGALWGKDVMDLDLKDIDTQLKKEDNPEPAVGSGV